MHARLKNEFTEDGKNHNFMTWLISCEFIISKDLNGFFSAYHYIDVDVIGISWIFCQSNILLILKDLTFQFGLILFCLYCIFKTFCYTCILKTVTKNQTFFTLNLWLFIS